MSKIIELPLDEIKRKYQDGYSTKQLFLMYGVGQHIIQRRLNSLRVILRDSYPYIKESSIEEIENIYLKNPNISLTKLAKKFGFSREGVKKRLIKRGIHVRSNSEIAEIKREIKIEDLCRTYNQVKSLRKVRKITGYSINFIKDCIKGKVQFPIYPRPLKEGFDKITKEKVRIYAHSIFDGHVSHSKYNSYTVGYTNKNPELLKEFEKDVELVYGFKSKRHQREDGVTQLYCCSKLMYLDILNFDKSIIKKKEEYKKIYLRAFFDDEGSVYFNPKKGMLHVTGTQHNDKEVKFIKSLLDDLEIQSRIFKFTITIGRNKSILKYSELIGFTHSDKRKKLLKGINHYKQKFENSVF